MIILSAIQFRTERTRAPKTATQKPETAKPFTKDEANQNKAPFKMRVKSPNVRMFIGRVINKRMGLMRMFIIVKTIAKMNAV